MCGCRYSSSRLSGEELAAKDSVEGASFFTEVLVMATDLKSLADCVAETDDRPLANARMGGIPGTANWYDRMSTVPSFAAKQAIQRHLRSDRRASPSLPVDLAQPNTERSQTKNRVG